MSVLASISTVITFVVNQPIYAQYFVSNCEYYSFDDISLGNGYALYLGDDYGTVVSLGFSFQFYNTYHTEIGVSSNGYLSFGSSLTERPTTSGPIFPSSDDPNDLIAVLWCDLDPSKQGQIYYLTHGTAPNRRFIVQWTGVPEYERSSGNTFQAILFETSNQIEFRYQTINIFEGYGIGIENQYGTEGLNVANYVSDGDCYAITDPDAQQTAQPTVTVSQCNYYRLPTTSGIILLSTEECALQVAFNGTEPFSVQYECISDSVMRANYYNNTNCDGYVGWTEEYYSDTDNEAFDCSGSANCNTATISQTCDKETLSLTVITDFCFTDDGSYIYGTAVTKCNDDMLKQCYYYTDTECIDANNYECIPASDLIANNQPNMFECNDMHATTTCNDDSDSTELDSSESTAHTAAGFIGALDLAGSIVVLIVLILVGIGCFIGIICCICCCAATQKHAIGAKEVSKQTEMTLTAQPSTTTKGDTVEYEGNQTAEAANPGEVQYNETQNVSNDQMTEVNAVKNDEIVEMQVTDNNYPSLEEGAPKESGTSVTNGDFYESKDYEAFNAMLNDEKYALVKEFIYEKVIILGECKPIYFKALIESGCDTLEKVKELSNQDLVDMGINNSGDRRMIIIKAKMLKL